MTSFLALRASVCIIRCGVYLTDSPGEYFISTVKIAFYTGILLTSPFLLSQLTFFVIPGLNAGEKKLILPLLIGSTVLFFISLGFSYFVLIPAALQFFISYSSFHSDF